MTAAYLSLLLCACGAVTNDVIAVSGSKVPVRAAPIVAGEISLCLSGGGYRAALFHAGVVEGLNELGLLPKLAKITGVSGGAIATAKLGLVWQKLHFDLHGVATNLHETFTEPLFELTSQSIDVKELMGTISPTGSNTLAKSYDRYLFGGKRLSDFPDPTVGPQFSIMATELTSGFSWQFSRDRMGSPLLGLLYEPDLRLADAVAASSAFPVAFRPVEIHFDRSQFSVPSPTTHELTTALVQVLRGLGKYEVADEIESGKKQVEDPEKVRETLRAVYESVYAKQIGDTVFLVDGGVSNNYGSGQCRDSHVNIVSSGSLDTPFRFGAPPTTLVDAMLSSVDRMNSLSQSKILSDIYNEYVKSAMARPCKKDLSECATKATIFVPIIPVGRGNPPVGVNVETRLKALSPDIQLLLVSWGKQRVAEQLASVSSQGGSDGVVR